MNTNILQKCLQELNKDKPDISYAKGILETFISLNSDNNAIFITQDTHVPGVVVRTEEAADERDPLEDAYLRGGTGKLS